MACQFGAQEAKGRQRTAAAAIGKGGSGAALEEGDGVLGR
jgi:hypothetical protein